MIKIDEQATGDHGTSDKEYIMIRKRPNAIPGAIGQLQQSTRLGKVLRHIYDKAIFKENDVRPIMAEPPGIQAAKNKNKEK